MFTHHRPQAIGGDNTTGAAIDQQAMARRLAAADSNVKLMILLTDGKPYDSDTYQDNAYAQEDTKMALREARREKIHLFCVTVDREGADYLPHMYSDANFVVVDDVRTLIERVTARHPVAPAQRAGYRDALRLLN